MSVDPLWTFARCAEDEALALAGELGIQRTTAEVLIRRGHTSPEGARAFMEQDGPAHDAFLLGDMEAACDRIEQAIASGERICVHGDYDVDGICATALAVQVLEELGAHVEWHLPSRFEEGYGVGVQALERVAASGVRLLLTVDCGITAVTEVERARELGMDVIITDHHRPGPALPDALRVATRPSDYPFPELCGSGVVFKLAEALHRRAGRDPADLERHLDLVALATVADVVPLLDENRRLVRAGLRRLARTTRPGLRALMVAARVDRTRIGAGDLGFRLGPRINAAGRLGHPGDALELLLTDDEGRARELADKLETLNRRRQQVESEILDGAVAQVEAADGEWRSRRAYVLASSEWHEGVIGIVASRLVERYGRPVVLIAIGDDEAKGSGRSIPAFDLHGGLAAAGGHLLRFGGHRAAAGLSIDPAEIDAFSAALARHADATLTDDDLRPSVRIDAVLAPGEVSLDLVDELARLEPFGLGNPGVTLLAPAATLRGVGAIGEGRHLRATVELGGFRCGAVGFGMGPRADALQSGGRVDVAYRLGRNEWNGAVAAQMLLRALVALPELNVDPPQPRGDRSHAAATVDLRGRGVQVATVARLAAAGEDVLVVVADRDRRRRMLRGPLSPAAVRRRDGRARRVRRAGRDRGLRRGGRARSALRRRVDAGAGDAGRPLPCAPGMGRRRDRVRPRGGRAARAAPPGADRGLARPSHRFGAEPASRDRRRMPGRARRAGARPGGGTRGEGRPRGSPTYREALERFALVERHLGAHAVG